MDDIKIFMLVVSTAGVIVTAFLTHMFTAKREKFAKIFEYKLKILTEVYTPLYRIIQEGVNPYEGYDGISFKQFERIDEIISRNLELVDPQLEYIVWILKEDLYTFPSDFNSNYVCLDENRKLVDYVEYQYNFIRKKLNLPYDSAKITLTERVIFLKQRYQHTKKTKKARKIIRKHNIN